MIGGYMFLRSLMGSVDGLYKFYDDPELIHDCMKTWLELADAVTARHQQYITIDELFLNEDICYNRGPLISPDMIREFLFLYYQQLIINIKSRQLDKKRHLYFNLDTDGFAASVIDLYMEIGMEETTITINIASGTKNIIVGNLTPSTQYAVKRNGATWNSYTADSNGCIIFTTYGTGSHVYKVELWF